MAQTIKVNGKTKKFNVVFEKAKGNVTIEIGKNGWVTVTTEYLGTINETTVYLLSTETNIWRGGQLIESEVIEAE